jgi:hypothetical protein
VRFRDAKNEKLNFETIGLIPVVTNVVFLKPARQNIPIFFFRGQPQIRLPPATLFATPRLIFFVQIVAYTPGGERGARTNRRKLRANDFK